MKYVNLSNVFLIFSSIKHTVDYNFILCYYSIVNSFLFDCHYILNWQTLNYIGGKKWAKMDIWRKNDEKMDKILSQGKK